MVQPQVVVVMILRGMALKLEQEGP